MLNKGKKVLRRTKDEGRKTYFAHHFSPLVSCLQSLVCSLQSLVYHLSSIVYRFTSLVLRPSSFAASRSSQKGVALITVIIVMLTMALIGTSLMELSSAVNFSVDNILNETKARYLAEAGIAHALHQIRRGGDLSSNLDAQSNAILYPLGEGFFSVEYNPSESLITCTGIVNETRKTLQLQYNVF